MPGPTSCPCSPGCVEGSFPELRPAWLLPTSRKYGSAETGDEKPYPEAYRRVLRTLSDEVEAVRGVIDAGREEICVPELCDSHG